jgi:hypothetical protein
MKSSPIILNRTEKIMVGADARDISTEHVDVEEQLSSSRDEVKLIISIDKSAEARFDCWQHTFSTGLAWKMYRTLTFRPGSCSRPLSTAIRSTSIIAWGSTTAEQIAGPRFSENKFAMILNPQRQSSITCPIHVTIVTVIWRRISMMATLMKIMYKPQISIVEAALLAR